MYVKYSNQQAKELKGYLKDIKKLGLDSVVVRYNISDEDKNIRISYTAWSIDMSINIEKIVNVDTISRTGYNNSKVVVSLDINDMLLDMISKDHYIELWKDNILSLSITNDGGTRYHYDTIIVYSLDRKGMKDKFIKHSDFGFDDMRLIR